MLARREFARAELEARLARRGFDRTAVGTALDDLEREGLLSDARLAASTVARRSGRVGKRAIERELRARGVARPARAAALTELATRDEFADALRLWGKRYDRAPASDRERARQYRFLIARGYTTEIALRVLREVRQRCHDGGETTDADADVDADR